MTTEIILCVSAYLLLFIAWLAYMFWTAKEEPPKEKGIYRTLMDAAERKQPPKFVTLTKENIYDEFIRLSDQTPKNLRGTYRCGKCGNIVFIDAAELHEKHYCHAGPQPTHHRD